MLHESNIKNILKFLLIFQKLKKFVYYFKSNFLKVSFGGGGGGGVFFPIRLVLLHLFELEEEATNII
jgi:hypothetical protein